MKLNKSYINVRFIRKHLFWGAAVLAACFFSLTCSSSDDILDQDGGPKVKPGGTTLVDGAVTFKNGWESEYFNGTLKDDPGTPYTNYNPVSTGNGNRAYIDFAVKTAELTQWRDVDMPAWQALEDAWAAYLSGDSEEEPGEPRRDPPVEPKKTVAYLPGSPVENDDGSSTVVGSVPEWDYHIFKGWKVNPGTPEAFDLRADTVLTESVIAVAQWDEIAAGRPYYTVTFEKNDGQGLMEKRLAFPTVNDTEKQAGDPSKYSVFKIVAADASGGIVAGNNVLPEFSRLYYDRSTWVTKNGTTETPVEPSNIEYSGDTTIYQKWTPQIAVITFNAGGIVSTPPQLTGLELPKLASGGINAAGAQLPAYPGTVSHNSEDYIFLGWYDAEDGGTQIGNDTPISDTAKTLYARWRKQNHYSATFYYNGTGSVAPTVQEWTVPISDTYIIEAYGAQGGIMFCANDRWPDTTRQVQSKGGYIKGEVDLSQGDVYYIYVGGKGENNTGGWNGGGNALPGTRIPGSGGGGASDIRKVKASTSDGTWNEAASLESRIIVAGGGGGGANGGADWLIKGGNGGKGIAAGGDGQRGNGESSYPYDYNGEGAAAAAGGTVSGNERPGAGGSGAAGQPGGGGGGGGYNGGAGGGAIVRVGAGGGGGGGGSSWAKTSGPDDQFSNITASEAGGGDYAGGNGKIVITIK